MKRFWKKLITWYWRIQVAIDWAANSAIKAKLKADVAALIAAKQNDVANVEKAQQALVDADTADTTALDDQVIAAA